jgi:hypothetical protein
VTREQAIALLSGALDSAEESNFGELRVSFCDDRGPATIVALYVDEEGVYQLGTCVRPSTASELTATAAAYARAAEFVTRGKLRPRG